MTALSGTLTIRLPAPALRRLRALARKRGVTPSELVREALARQVEGMAEPEQTAMELTRKWVGSVTSGDVPAGRRVREALADWMPDRRG